MPRSLSLTFLVAFLVALAGCEIKVDTKDTTIETGGTTADADHDGYGPDDDCDDNDAGVNPSATEVCDGLDNDCDLEIDEAVTTPYYRDGDVDGFGDNLVSVQACQLPAGYVPNGSDCDDTNPAIYPGNPEICDGLDNDCNGQIDEGVMPKWFADEDDDDFGNPTKYVMACVAPDGYVIDSTDCNDGSDVAWPGNKEVCDSVDNDCDGSVDEEVGFLVYADYDADGWGDALDSMIACDLPKGYVARADDCNDQDATIHPDASEVCNGIDDNCDGSIDENAGDPTTWYADADGDGRGDPNNTLVVCSPPVGYIADHTDCDDTDPTVYPGASEVCDGSDNDCDGFTDEPDAIDAATWYSDSDGDGFGNANTTRVGCNQPMGFVSDSTDCVDTNTAIHPSAAEFCNGVDDDCDGAMDEADALDANTWYQDADADGYGLDGTGLVNCNQLQGYVIDNTDCNDGVTTIHPNAVELCDSIDNDCDGSIDENGTDPYTWYLDSDGDGYGDASITELTCNAPVGYVLLGTDCDDSDAAVYPGAVEDCNGMDDDCDGAVDEAGAIGSFTWYVDMDGDKFGDPNVSMDSCTVPLGYVTDNTDCDDTRAGVYPAADEYCNGIDDDCDGAVDENDAIDVWTWYLDGDLDGYGDAARSVLSCYQPSGFVNDDMDCNDRVASVNPGASELCNGVDDDCDGTVDENSSLDALSWYRDADQDGYGNASTRVASCTQPAGFIADDTDCNDQVAATHPLADEYCDNIDNDCDGLVDEQGAVNPATWYSDSDSDGYGDPNHSQQSCIQPNGYVSDNTDCNDGMSNVNPAGIEHCNGYDDDCDASVDEADAVDARTWYRDADIDGFGASASSRRSCNQPLGYVADYTDCDDRQSTVYPGADEYCNSRDDDCDGIVDENTSIDALTWYQDGDQDGYGNASITTLSCIQPTGYVQDRTDCNDSVSTIHPSASEYCNSIDDDCDGAVDENSVDVLTWYRDVDGDGYGNAAVTTLGCTRPSGYVSNSTDCNDMMAVVYPGASEFCNGQDDDCDGLIDENNAVDVRTWYRDSDQDGYGNLSSTTTACNQPTGYVSNYFDCNDSSATVNPGATEYCNGVDDNCNGTTDENSATGAPTWYRDADADTFGNISSSTIACNQPTGYVSNSTDCNDSAATANPAASEVCDGIDNDCDASIDEASAIDATRWYADSDSDRFGSSTLSVVACTAPTGYVSAGGDCNDTVANIYPGAPELCDGLDNNCNGLTDDGVTNYTFYRDADSDTYGNIALTSTSCSQPAGYVSNSRDCNDANASISPSATEICDGIDNDCNGTVDDNTASNAATWYVDSDNDSYGNTLVTTRACTQPSGYVSNSTDCNDTASSINPGATEYCNGVDDNCNGTTDENTSANASTWYRDSDRDTYGNPAVSSVACSAPTGYVLNNTDCNDGAASINPGASEYCNSVDDDCDGSIDETSSVDARTWYRDADADTYGNALVTTPACTQPTGYVSNSTDCDDTRAAVYPGRTELCSTAYDDNCNGVINETTSIDALTWYRDADADTYGNLSLTTLACTQPTGYVANSTDCNDSAAAVNPGVAELCNGIDDNCNGTVDENSATNAPTWYRDSDNDTYGNASSSTRACTQPTGYVANSTDCNDTVSTINPGATEYCNLVDDNCNGTIDENTAANAATWYRDADADTYGNLTVTTRACTQPTGYVANSTDCDDTRNTVNPSRSELCSTAYDDNCNGVINESTATDALTWYRNADSDGYGLLTSTTRACTQPTGYVANSTDCDDTRANVYPGATEYCDSLDNDCDGVVDDNPVNGTTYYRDADNDQLGTPTSTIQACSLPSGYRTNTWDCRDSDASEPAVVNIATGSSAGAGTMTSPLASIQAGVTLADYCVIVFAGTYAETVNLGGKSLDVWGVSGEASTIINPNLTTCTYLNPTTCRSVVTIASGSNAHPTIHGFTIQGGTGTESHTTSSQTCADSSAAHNGDNTCTVTVYDYCGGGIYIGGDDPYLYDLTIKNNVLPAYTRRGVGDFIQYWLYSYGGGICAEDAVVDMEHVKIYSNDADEGGGIYATTSSVLTAEHIHIGGNTATDGAGANVDGASFAVNNSALTCNAADTDGGGIFISYSGSSVTAVNIAMYGNTSPIGATHGSSIYGSASTTLSLTNSIVFNTVAAYALYGAGTGTITYTDVYNNSTSPTYRIGGTYPTGGAGLLNANPSFTLMACDGINTNDNFHLNAGSPAINTGNPSASYNDADGTRNDMGAYGGPMSSW